MTMKPLGKPLATRLGAAALAAFVASAWIAPALAQPAPPPGAPGAPPPPGALPGPPPGMPPGPPPGPPGGPPGGGPMGWMHRHGPHAGGPMGGLLMRREDKALTTADVQKIAEAFLLWHGERNWRIADVKEGPNNTVEFALTTAEGSVIARFAMDRRTGRPQRIS